MKTSRAPMLIFSLVCFAGSWLSGNNTFAQSPGVGASSSSTQVSYQAAQSKLVQDQASLAAEAAVLVAQGATRPQLQAWEAKNKVRMDILRQDAQTVVASQPLAAAPYIGSIIVSDGDPPGLVNLHSAQADLYNSTVLSAYQVQAAGMSGQSAKPAITSLSPSQGVLQSGQVLASSAPQALPLPPPLYLPAGISSQMQVLLKLRDQLWREKIQLWNQYLNASADQRETALLQWSQQNKDRINQLSALAQATTN